MRRVIFHLDMDAFYASIEQRETPALRGQPVIVGSPPERRGVVCAASYEARRFGVRSAMPSSKAARLCPAGIFIPPRIDLYREESRKIMEIVGATGAEIEQVSIDEAYLELTAQLEPFAGSHDELLESTVPLARDIKQKIAERRNLTASIGIASNKFLAKLGSDYDKPNGLTLIPEETKATFLRPLPVRAIHGVGAVTEKTLHQAGVFKIADLQDYSGDLRALAGSFGRELRELAFGRDSRPLNLGDDIRSISAEETFERDTEDRVILRQCLWSQAREVAAKLSRKQLTAQTVQVKVRYKNFQTLTRQVTVQDPLADARGIYRLACWLLARHQLVKSPLRLLGLGASTLKPAEMIQLRLF